MRQGQGRVGQEGVLCVEGPQGAKGRGRKCPSGEGWSVKVDSSLCLLSRGAVLVVELPALSPVDLSFTERDLGIPVQGLAPVEGGLSAGLPDGLLSRPPFSLAALPQG